MERPSGDGSGAGGALVPATRSMVPTTGVKQSTAESKSLERKSQRKEKTTSVKVESVKIEASTCPRCFCKTFKGQIECDICGLMLDAPKANRTKIAERRKEELRKLGL